MSGAKAWLILAVCVFLQTCTWTAADGDAATVAPETGTWEGGCMLLCALALSLSVSRKTRPNLPLVIAKFCKWYPQRLSLIAQSIRLRSANKVPRCSCCHPADPTASAGAVRSFRFQAGNVLQIVYINVFLLFLLSRTQARLSSALRTWLTTMQSLGRTPCTCSSSRPSRCSGCACSTI